MVFQRTFLLNLSVWRNMWIGLWLASVPANERRERCRHALARVGLLGHINRPARMLSGGVLIGDDYGLAPVRETFTAFFAGRSDAYAVLPWGQLVVVKSAGN